MKKKFLGVLIALSSLAVPAAACINAVGTNHKGERIEPISHTGAELAPYLVDPMPDEFLLSWSAEAVKASREDPSFDNLNNLAAVLIHHGRLPKALALLQYLERKFPGRYETASNMGTAYELMGRNEDALTWIQEGMKRNASDHYGTEWLHVHILKAKLGRLPAAAPGRSILDLDVGGDAMPRRPKQLPVDHAGKTMSLRDVARALRYQLIERIAFVPAPDPLVAGLLLDWANLELFGGSVESADVLYDAALRYGSSERRVIALRKAQVAKALARSTGKPTTSFKLGECELCAPRAEGDTR